MAQTEAGTKLTGKAATPSRPVLSYGGLTALSLVAVLIILELVGRQANPLFASPPSAILSELVRMTANGRLVAALLESLKPFAVGYVVAAAIGIPLGVLLGRFRTMEALFGIYVTAGYAMPLVALVPLYVLWFGLGTTVKVAIIATLAFFPICINTWIGVKNVPKALVEVGQSFVASRQEILTKIVLPASIPYVMAGLRLGIGKAIIGMIVAEFFTAISGLGGIIINAANSFETAEMLAPIIVIMVFAVVLTGLLGWTERKIAPWQAELMGREE